MEFILGLVPCLGKRGTGFAAAYWMFCWIDFSLDKPFKWSMVSQTLITVGVGRGDQDAPSWRIFLHPRPTSHSLIGTSRRALKRTSRLCNWHMYPWTKLIWCPVNWKEFFFSLHPQKAMSRSEIGKEREIAELGVLCFCCCCFWVFVKLPGEIFQSKKK